MNKMVSMIDAFTQIRRGNIEALADALAKGNGTIKVKTAGLKKEEIVELYSKVVASSNGTYDDIKKRADALKEREPQIISKKSITSEELSAMLKGKKHVVADGSEVLFVAVSLGKLNVPAIKETGVAASIVDLLKTADFVYSQVDYHDETGIHKQRHNVIEYRNYVTPFNNGEGEWYCRFTVEHFNDARLVSHGARVSDIGIMKKDLQNSLTAPGESQPLGATESLSDTKLLNFFYFANNRKQIMTGKEFEILVKDKDVHTPIGEVELESKPVN